MGIKIIILILLVLFSYSVLAEEITLTKGQSITSGGHTITLVNVGTNNIIVSVDGVKNIVSLDQKKTINGVEILPVEIVYAGFDTDTAKMFISVEEELTFGGNCGNDICESSEDKSSCCADCGCESGYSCSNNKCEKNECSSDEECYSTPKDYCVSDKCLGKPKKCSHTPITECIVNDKCCPTNCYYPDDPDCSSAKLNPNQKTIATTSNITKMQENKTEANLSTPIKETKKESFFAKIINWFKGLFE